jgi:hypothetical protein
MMSVKGASAHHKPMAEGLLGSALGKVDGGAVGVRGARVGCVRAPRTGYPEVRSRHQRETIAADRLGGEPNGGADVLSAHPVLPRYLVRCLAPPELAEDELNGDPGTVDERLTAENFGVSHDMLSKPQLGHEGIYGWIRGTQSTACRCEPSAVER